MAKKLSRADRWKAAVKKAQEALAEVKDARSNLEEALSELDSVQEEYENWKDSLPENLESSAVGEKLDAVCDLDLDLLDNIDVDSVESALDEAEGLDLPLGFGRD